MVSVTFESATIANHTALQRLGAVPETTEAPHDLALNATEAEWNAEAQYKLYRVSPTECYLCRIPAFNATTKAVSSRILGGDEREDLLASGLELLKPLKKVCLLYTEGWFTYEFCYGDKIRQYHAVERIVQKNAATHVKDIEPDPTQPIFILGKWPRERKGGLEPAAPADRASKLMPEEVRVSVEKQEVRTEGGRVYIQQDLGKGTTCDINGNERSIEVLLTCEAVDMDYIASIVELSTCH